MSVQDEYPGPRKVREPIVSPTWNTDEIVRAAAISMVVISAGAAGAVAVAGVFRVFGAMTGL